MLRCSTLTTSYCAAWCPLHQVVLFDLVCMVLGCLIFSASCCRLISPAYPCVMCCLIFSAWLSLPHAMLLNLPYRCYVSWRSLYHVNYAVWSCHQDGTLLDLLYLMLRSWPSFVELLVFFIYILEFFVWSSCCYAAWHSLPLVRLLGLP